MSTQHTGRHRHTGSDTSRFLAAVARHPRQLGAIAPSGPHLAAQAANLLDADTPQTVVELGPGSGVITDALHQRLPAGRTLLAVEMNTDMVAHLRRTRPWVEVVAGDAADLAAIMASRDLPRADAVVSALPWTLFSDTTQLRVLRAVRDVLRPGGLFTTVVTWPARGLPPARRLRRHLGDILGDVETTPLVWRNMPPAQLYVCRKRPNGEPARHHSTCGEATALVGAPARFAT